MWEWGLQVVVFYSLKQKTMTKWIETVTTHEQVLKGNCRQILERAKALKTMEVNKKPEDDDKAMTMWDRLKE